MLLRKCAIGLWVFLGCVSPLVAQPNNQKVDLQQIVNALLRVQQAIRSMEAQFKETITNTPEFMHMSQQNASDAGNTSIPAKEAYRVTCAVKGTKIYVLQTPLDNSLSQQLGIYDGHASHQIEAFSKKKGALYDAVSHRLVLVYADSPFLRAYKPFGQWLTESIYAGEGKLVRKTFDPKIGLVCEIVTHNAGTAEQHFWVAQKYGWAVIRAELVTKGMVVLKAECSQFHRVNSVWVPSVCTVKWYGNQNGRSLLLSNTEMTNAQYQFNQVPDSLFDIHLAPGAIVYDMDTQTRFLVGPGGIEYPEIH